MKKGLFKRNWGKFVSALLPMVSTVNFFSPSWLATYALTKIGEKMKGYRIDFGHLSISYLSAFIRISDFRLYKVNGTIEELFISVKSIEVKYSRIDLWNNEIKCEVKMACPVLNIVMGDGKADKPEKQMEVSPASLPPIKVSEINITGGQVNFTDPMIQPPLKLHVGQIDIVGSMLSNIPGPAKTLPGEIELRASAYDGSLKVNVKTNFAISPPLFDMNAEFRMINMVKLNDLFRAYGKFDVSKGSMSLFAEAASADGRFKGYVKPIIENLQIAGPEDKVEGFWHQLWENLLGATASLLENDDDHKEIATKIPFDGTYKDTHLHLGYAVLVVLKNAFISALRPAIDYEINIDDVLKRG